MKSLLTNCSFHAVDPDCITSKCVYRCRSCALHHRLVECGGIYHCPNPLCRSCGADWFRSGRKSYTTDNKGRTLVDMTELVADGLRFILETRQDPEIRDAAFACGLRWIREYHLDSPELTGLVKQIPAEVAP